jgi:hypothetical protein
MKYESSSFLPLFDGPAGNAPGNKKTTEYFGFSLLQPWAALFAAGLKIYETRSWGKNITGKLIIHASAGFPPFARELCHTEHFAEALLKLSYKSWQDLPTGALVGSVVIKRTYSTEKILPTLGLPEMAFGDYSPGRRAWEAEKPILYQNPIPCKGARSIWKMPPELYAAIELDENSK